MSFAINPFNTLYLTEGVGEVDIPAIFSPLLVPHVTQLYQPGNVVLRGMQGTGKTMLLSLLDTNVRLAFWSRSPKTLKDEISTSDPLPLPLRTFVGAGINLSSSKAFKLNEIRVSKDREENIQLSRAYFGDFVNTWVVRDLLMSIETLIKELTLRGDLARLDEIGVTANLDQLDVAVKLLGADTAGQFLGRKRTAAEARTELKGRVEAYLQLVRDPLNSISKKIDKSRRLLGEPIEAATLALREAGVISDRTNVIVTIDQFEQLIRRAPHDGDDQQNRRFIHEVEDLFSHRVRQVSYRVGTRPNATLDRCDAVRDYVLVDLDQILQRKEHGRPLFHGFARDAFRRRIKKSDIPHADEIAKAAAPLKDVFGKSPTVADRGRACAPKKPSQLVRLDKNWPADVKAALLMLAKKDAIAASLGEAWVRQQSAKGIELDVSGWDSPTELPWEQSAKCWWKKERLSLAALHVAASNAQRLVYYGEKDILQLAGENIVAFICICREIWDCSARHRANKTGSKLDQEWMPFDPKRQTEGIRDASHTWHDKMRECPGGDSLQRFLDKLGGELHEQLIGDRQMSYPGANGISLAVSDLNLDQNRDVRQLLYDATAECFLLQRDHTPKLLSRGKSLKWYPHPILAPFYELTVAHTKEPLYLNVSKLRDWLAPLGLLSPGDEPTTKTKLVRIKPKKATQDLRQKQKTLFAKDE